MDSNPQSRGHHPGRSMAMDGPAEDGARGAESGAAAIPRCAARVEPAPGSSWRALSGAERGGIVALMAELSLRVIRRPSGPRASRARR